MKKRKWKINWGIVERNLLILLNVSTISLFVYKIVTNGINWTSTIGYFG